MCVCVCVHMHVCVCTCTQEGRKKIFYLTTHSTHFIYGYMASDIWLRTILIVRKETRCRHIGYSYRLIARVLLYAPSHRQDSTYHGLCYTSRYMHTDRYTLMHKHTHTHTHTHIMIYIYIYIYIYTNTQFYIFV